MTWTAGITLITGVGTAGTGGSTSMMASFLSFFKKIFFCLTLRHVGSWFPDQRWNPRSLNWKLSLNDCTAGEVPKMASLLTWLWAGLGWLKDRLYHSAYGHRATKPVCHNYWSQCPLGPSNHKYWACVLQLLKPVRLEPVLHSGGSHQNEKPTHRNEE